MGWSVWIHGPFPGSVWPDISIFHYDLKNLLDENECMEADDGYIGEDPKLIKVPKGIQYEQKDSDHMAA